MGFGGSTTGLDLLKRLTTPGEFGNDGIYVAVQMKGFGFSFHAERNSSIAAGRSSTPRKEPRRIRLLVNSANQRSIRFSQLHWWAHSA
jgi:hypothetical protein